jgi:hypothetical protein
MSLVDDITKDRLIKYQSSVLKNIHVQMSIVNEIYANCDPVVKADRKEFAEFAKKQEPYTRYLFNLLSGKDMGIMKTIESACSSQTHVEAVRGFIGDSYYSF